VEDGASSAECVVPSCMPLNCACTCGDASYAWPLLGVLEDATAVHSVRTIHGADSKTADFLDPTASADSLEWGISTSIDVELDHETCFLNSTASRMHDTDKNRDRIQRAAER